MKGTAKLIRRSDGIYRVYVRNHFWQRWKPLYIDGTGSNQVSFRNMREFGEVTRIECFDEITVKYDKFAGYDRNGKTTVQE